MKHACKFIEHVNKEEVKPEGQKRTSRRGMIKVSGIIHRRAKKSDTRLNWMMFQNIYLMYRNIKEKEERNSTILLTSI